MKKILVTVLSFIAFISAHGAAVSWTTGVFSSGFSDPMGEKLTADMGYSVEVNVYADAGKESLIAKSTSSTVNGKTGALSGDVAATFSASTKYYVTAIIQNTDYIRSTDLLSFTTPGEGDAALNFLDGSGLTNPSGGSNTWGDWKEKGGDVPEPTTCSLLLVGLAGMGLKRLRKRGKKSA